MPARKPAKKATPAKPPKRGLSKAAAAKLGALPFRPARGAADPSETPRTTSKFTPRLQATREGIEAMLKSRFAKVEPVFAYNMHGWKVRRPVTITDWPGTMDPNWITVFVAERAQGVTVHLWNPYEYKALKRHEKQLVAAGYKVMVGCVNYNRKGDVPLDAIAPILDEMQAAWKKEARS